MFVGWQISKSINYYDTYLMVSFVILRFKFKMPCFSQHLGSTSGLTTSGLGVVGEPLVSPHDVKNKVRPDVGETKVSPGVGIKSVLLLDFEIRILGLTRPHTQVSLTSKKRGV